MKATSARARSGHRTVLAQQSLALITVCITATGCAGLKVLTGTYELLDSDRILAVQPGASMAEVEASLGSPESRNEGEHVYLYVGIRASEGGPVAQEAHIYFDDADIVDSTTYAIIMKGRDKVAEVSTVLDALSDLEVGQTTVDDGKRRHPFNSHDLLYKNGDLSREVFHYATDRAQDALLSALPFVGTVVHDDGSASYWIAFGPTGRLAAATD